MRSTSSCEMLMSVSLGNGVATTPESALLVNQDGARSERAVVETKSLARLRATGSQQGMLWCGMLTLSPGNLFVYWAEVLRRPGEATTVACVVFSR